MKLSIIYTIIVILKLIQMSEGSTTRIADLRRQLKNNRGVLVRSVKDRTCEAKKIEQKIVFGKGCDDVVIKNNMCMGYLTFYIPNKNNQVNFFRYSFIFMLT